MRAQRMTVMGRIILPLVRRLAATMEPNMGLAVVRLALMRSVSLCSSGAMLRRMSSMGLWLIFTGYISFLGCKISKFSSKLTY